VVEMEDGSIADVEIQKIPYCFPGERAACYSADLLMRQYLRVKGEKGKRFSYRDIKTVYTVVLLEKSGEPFQEIPGAWLHKSKQGFDTGLKMEFPQRFVFIALDMFQRVSQNKVKGELEAWMQLLSSDSPEVLFRIAGKYPVFREIYEEIEAFRQDIGGVLNMFSDALRILDRNTVQLMIDDMNEKLEETKEKLEETKEELEGAKEELEGTKEELEGTKEELEGAKGKVQKQADEIEQQAKALEEKEKRIKELENLLKGKDH